jgi:predicted  nucleic acid-binding Zn-ribbon protein
MTTTPGTDEQQQEIERLRARVAQLEQELVDQAARSNRAVAEAQEQLYWLERWHVDLNALMRKPGAAEFRALIRAARAVVRRLRAFGWRLKALKNKLTGAS